MIDNKYPISRTIERGTSLRITILSELNIKNMKSNHCLNGKIKYRDKNSLKFPKITKDRIKEMHLLLFESLK